MGAYQFQALDANGKTQTGVLQADTARAARGALRERGLTPLVVDAVAPSGPAQTRVAPWRRARIGGAQLAILARQLATLVKAGLPMDEALAALSEENQEPRTRAVVAQLRARVLEGQSLAQALAEFPESFPEAFRASVAAGESAGRLDQALARVAEYSESREALGRQIWLALAYPILLLVISSAVVIGLLAYVVPQVVSVFDHLGQKLPWATRALIAIANAVRAYGLWALLAIVVLAVATRFALRGESAHLRWDAFWLRVPVVGRLIRATNTARAARTLATLIASGVPALEAMQLAAATVRSAPMQAALKRAALRVREGGAFAKALSDSGQFPPVTVRLIASGEKSGRLDSMLDEAARHQQNEVETTLGTLTALLGPSVILLVGGLVLFIVLAILLPIFELNQLIR